ncbi:NACHT domain-containing protein [Paractinoplanes toevensis]|uniref:NACHT domain-containing protein n=1 Tax=Paractinoplanes toevensis TaxID=571911 RepID=A0A919T9G3_9ACTN|nr:NACHT domain-containing protein [Actinoplanes toevensis]GIM90149.1 hypothetical protein Ato02nite_019420 [Actinoplanes toevensis]
MGIAPLLSIGLPLVRVLLRLQNPSGGDLADSITDFSQLATSVKDRADQREIGRNLERISDKVIRRLDKFIQIEFRKATEDEIERAAGIVAAALTRAGSADLTAVVSNDVQVRALERYTLEHSDFATEAAELGSVTKAAGRGRPDLEDLAYKLLRETCYEVVELAHKHPNLTATALAGLLSRTTELRELLDSVDRSLNDLPGRTAALTGEDQRTEQQRAFGEFALDYRRAVANDQDKLELYGVDLIREVRRYSLTAAYLSLRLAVSWSDDDQAGDGDVAAMLPAHGLAVLRGAAGAGKTTILQWLATNVARRTLSGRLAHLNDHVPFVIKLRNYADRPFPKIAGLAADTTQSTLVGEPDGWIGDVFQQNVLLLVDGLDELSDRKQEDLVTWLEGFEGLGRRVLIVLTSRPTADPVLRSLSRLGFSTTRIIDVLPLDREQIRSFVMHWHTAIASQFTGAERAKLEGQAGKVAAKVSSDREYLLLASSPLLCAVLCALFHLKRGILPSHRIEIYDTLLNLLLGDRDAHKRVEVDQVRLSPTEKRMVLEEIADFMLTNELSEAEHSRIVDVVGRSGVASRFGSATPQEVVRHLLARSGILRTPSEGLVDFVHRTFLEYLAARSLVRQDRIELLASNVEKANWNEAVVLAAGVGIERQVELLVGAVVARAEAADDPLLSVTCASLLDTALVVPKDLRPRILRIIARIVPPMDEATAKACAAAGNSLLQPMRDALQAPDLHPLALQTSIRTLGEIGTPEALAVLGAIPARHRVDAIKQLVAVWTWFDPREFAETVLRNLAPERGVPVTLPNSMLLPHIRGLHANFLWECAVEVPEESFNDNCRDVRIQTLWVSNLQVLQDPRARDGEFLWTIDGLRRVRADGLRSVRVTADSDAARAGSIEDVTFRLRNGSIGVDVWDHLPGLRSIELGGDVEVDFRGLCRSTRLHRLILDGKVRSSEPTDFDLPALTELHWADTDDTELLMSIVYGAPELQRVSIAGVSGLANLDFLSRAASLRVVELTDLEDLSDVSTLVNLGGLQTVKVGGNHALESSRSLELLASEVEDLAIDGLDLGRFSWSEYDASVAVPVAGPVDPEAAREQDQAEAMEKLEEEYGPLLPWDEEERVWEAELELEDPDVEADIGDADQSGKSE